LRSIEHKRKRTFLRSIEYGRKCKPSGAFLKHVTKRVRFAAKGVARGTVPLDNLRPSAKNVQITLNALKDIRSCGKLFDKWMTELDKCVANPFSRHRVPSNDNNIFTESRAATPITQTIESES
jgi:hypothetical protein